MHGHNLVVKRGRTAWYETNNLKRKMWWGYDIYPYHL